MGKVKRFFSSSKIDSIKDGNKELLLLNYIF